MDVLYTSRRILIESDDGEFDFIDGGILVAGGTGKISEVFVTQETINSFLYSKPGMKVCIFTFHIYLLVSYLSLAL